MAANSGPTSSDTMPNFMVARTSSLIKLLQITEQLKFFTPEAIFGFFVDKSLPSVKNLFVEEGTF